MGNRRAGLVLFLGVGEPAVDELPDAFSGFSFLGVGHAPGFHAAVFLEDVHRGIQAGELDDYDVQFADGNTRKMYGMSFFYEAYGNKNAPGDLIPRCIGFPTASRRI